MTRRPTMDALLTACDEQGLFVHRLPLPEDWTGAYHHPTRTIYLRAGDPDWAAAPALMHELAHARRADDGHQCARVETHINRAIASRLITPAEYAAAEHIAGPSSGAIADELDLPRWVVSAYRQILRTAA